MARKIAWKDVASLPHFKNQKVILDSSFQYIFNPGLLSSSLLSIVSPSSGFYSAVEVLNSGKYPFLLGQLFHAPGDATARVVFLAPITNNHDQAFGRVLSQLTKAAGERGALQIKAEVEEDSFAEEILIQAGYRSFADQQIWKLPRRIVFGTGKKAWVPVTQDTTDPAATFCQKNLPGQVQRIEDFPEASHVQELISWEEGRIVGFAAAQFGPRGILVDLVLALDLDQVDEYLSALFFHLPYRDTREVYFRVRSYQQQIASALERVEAEAGPNQKVMVKRLTVHYNAKQTFRVRGFENQPDITTPISNTKFKN